MTGNTQRTNALIPGDIAAGKNDSEHVEIPTRNLPAGVGPASYCPSMLRTIAEAHNRSHVHEPLDLKPWVVLTLLDAVSDYEGLRQVAGDAMDDRDALAAKLERLPQLLKDHYLTGIQCDPIKKMDWPTCQCSMVDLGWHPSIGEAVDAWVAHLLKELGDE